MLALKVPLICGLMKLTLGLGEKEVVLLGCEVVQSSSSYTCAVAFWLLLDQMMMMKRRLMVVVVVVVVVVLLLLLQLVLLMMMEWQGLVVGVLVRMVWQSFFLI